jgi:hypothetical protein
MPENTNETTVETVTETEDTTKPTTSPMTAEQFNRAMTAKEKAFEKRLAKQQEEFQSMLKTFVPAPKEEPQLSRTAELEKTVKELSRTLQERDQSEKAARLRSVTEKALINAGVAAEFGEHAVSFLLDAKKAVRYDSSGQIIMTVGGIEYEDLTEGMQAWAATNDAKIYKKPSQAVGSGDTTRRAGQRGTYATASNIISPNGQINIKRRADADKIFDAHNPRSSSLSRESKIVLSEIVGRKLLERK